ncbi:hypothetical protein [Aestuariivirga sp.]|uniref:hypothetical protein n=1 Tax=Aestuariivirga sp. TaxID=2650926 RepID=UPI003BAA6173
MVAIIWITGLLAVVSLSTVIAVRSQTLRTRNAVSAELAQGVADGLLRREALTWAVGSSGETRRPARGQWSSCQWDGGATAWISVQDQAGLAGLNTATPNIVLMLLEGLVHARPQALALQQAMADFRDEDKLTPSGEPEPSRYPGRSFGPKNQAFAAVEELDQIPGFTDEVRARLSALTTVYSQQQGILASAAPPELLRLLYEASPAPGTSLGAQSSGAYAIVVAVALKDGSRFVRRAVIEVTGQPQRPFAIDVWSRAAWPPDLPAAAGGARCLD